MNKFGNTTCTIDGKSVRLGVDFTKVDKKNRLVSGFASLDNVDTQNDIVLSDASLRAFERSRKNLREMHQPIAVGKVVDFEEQEYFDAESGNTYKGVYVTARVSEGAQDTWLKVLDGTLSGFSIGGAVLEADTHYSAEHDAPIQIIKDYQLTELSLVDSPANPLSNVTGIHKVMEFNQEADGSVTVKGMVAQQEIHNVFFCEHDRLAIHKMADNSSCTVCETEMKNIGFYENGGDDSEKVKEIVNKYLEADEGGVEMGTENDSVEEEAVEVEETEAVNEDVSEEVGEVEKSADSEEVAEVEDDSEEINKVIDELRDAVTASIEKSREDTEAAIKNLEEKMDQLTNNFEKKFDECEGNLSALGERLSVQKSNLDKLKDSFTKFASSGALKKSSEVVTEEVEQENDNFWGGAFSLNSQ